MKTRTLVTTVALVLFAVQSKAGSIPYQNIGTVAPTNTFVADATGDITGYFVEGGLAEGGGAWDTDYVELIDVTTRTSSGWVFDNQTTAIGTTLNLGYVNAGDVLEFELQNRTLGVIVSSNPADSSDGLNHVYATTWRGGNINGAYIPAGTYIALEDEPLTFGGDGHSDFNYNDDAFVIDDDDFDPPVIPEPGSFYLLGTGLLALIGIGRRKLRVKEFALNAAAWAGR
jgi:hypothetical protein